MKKIAQLDGNRVHWLFESEEIPEFHPSIILLEVTGNEEVQEGWIYNPETETFSEPVLEVNSVVVQPTTSIEEQILAESQYTNALLEMQILGGK